MKVLLCLPILLLSACATGVRDIDTGELARQHAETQQMYYMMQHMQSLHAGNAPVVEIEGELVSGADGRAPRVTIYAPKQINPIQQFQAELSTGAKWADTIKASVPWIAGAWGLVELMTGLDTGTTVVERSADTGGTGQVLLPAALPTTVGP